MFPTRRIAWIPLCLTLSLPLLTGCTAKPAPLVVVSAPYPVVIAPPAHLLKARKIPPRPKGDNGSLTARQLAMWAAALLEALGASEGDKRAVREWVNAQESEESQSANSPKRNETFTGYSPVIL